MSADAQGSRVPVHSPLRPARASLFLEEPASAIPAESSAGFRTCSRSAELHSKDCSKFRLSGASRRSRRQRTFSTAENATQQDTSSLLGAHAQCQLDWDENCCRQRRQHTQGEREDTRHARQRDPSSSVCVAVTSRRAFLFDCRRRWCLSVFFSFAFLLLAFHHSFHDDSLLFRGNSIFSAVPLFSPCTFLTALHPIFSPLSASLSSSQTSVISDAASTTAAASSMTFRSVDAAGPRKNDAKAEGLLTGSSPARQAAPAVGADRDTSAARDSAAEISGAGTTEERAEEASTSTNEAAVAGEFVPLSSDFISAGGIELYSYRRAGNLTLLHDATAGGPASAPAGHRLAARQPPFTQGLIASPFQRPLASSGAASVAKLGAAEPAGRKGRSSTAGDEQLKTFSTPAEECLFRFGGASVLLETSGLYSQSYIREFDICTGETVRQLYLHPRLFAEGAAFLWEPQQQQLLLLVLTWRERLLLVLHAETWKMIGTLKTHFDGWGLASNLSVADAAAAVAFVKEGHEAAAGRAAAAGATVLGTVHEEAPAGQQEEAEGRSAASAAAAAASEKVAAKRIFKTATATDDAEVAAREESFPQKPETELRQPRKKKKKEEVTAASLLLPMVLQQRLQQQRLWATTGTDVLLELDVPRLLESVRQLPRYAAVVAASATPRQRSHPRRRRSSREVYNASGVVNEEVVGEGATDSSSAAGDAVAAETDALAASDGIHTADRKDVEASAGEKAATATDQPAGRRTTQKKKKTKNNEEEFVSATPFDANVEETGAPDTEEEEEEEEEEGDLRAAAASPLAVRVARTVPLRCLGAPLPMLNELEYLQERNSLLANIYGAYILAEVDVDSGACRSLGSFGGLAGVLRSADEYDRVMNGIALLPPRVRFSSPFPFSSSAAGHGTSAGAAVAAPGGAAAADNAGVVGEEGGLDRHVLEDTSLSNPLTLLANSARAVLSPFTVLYALLQNSSSSSSSGAHAAGAETSAAATSASAGSVSAADVPAVGHAYPSTLVLTGKQWQELHVVETVPLYPHKSLKRGLGGGTPPLIDSYPAVEAAFPGFFSRLGLQAQQQHQLAQW